MDVKQTVNWTHFAVGIKKCVNDGPLKESGRGEVVAKKKKKQIKINIEIFMR